MLKKGVASCGFPVKPGPGRPGVHYRFREPSKSSVLHQPQSSCPSHP